jgi:hypothetical protein
MVLFFLFIVKNVIQTVEGIYWKMPTVFAVVLFCSDHLLPPAFKTLPYLLHRRRTKRVITEDKFLVPDWGI